MYSRKKPKNFAFLKIPETEAFWLKDFSQKVLIIKFREGQKKYFGKKEMSLHVDVFFIKQNGNIRKRVFISVYHCNQGIADTLSLALTVLDKFKDHPNIRDIYAKSYLCKIFMIMFPLIMETLFWKLYINCAYQKRFT